MHLCEYHVDLVEQYQVQVRRSAVCGPPFRPFRRPGAGAGTAAAVGAGFGFGPGGGPCAEAVGVRRLGTRTLDRRGPAGLTMGRGYKR